MDRNRLIGSGGRLPWHLPADLKHFKQTTLGKPVVMGRRTHQSIGKPLPERTNIVLTRNAGYRAPGCIVVASLEQAIEAAAGAQEIMIIGGAELYRRTLPRADRLYLTRVEGEFEGDTWFPQFDADEWIVERSEGLEADDKNPFACSIEVLSRRQA